jgi:hypothetical protein
MGWQRISMSIVICGTLAVAGCDRPARVPAQPTGSVPPTSAPPTSAPARPPALGGPTASVLPSPTAAPASPMLILFRVLRNTTVRAGAEVTRPERLDEFVGRFHPEDQGLDRSVRAEVAPWRAYGARVFAFLLAGCANDGATLVVEPDRVYARLTGGENVQCDTFQYYLAVFAVPAGLVPDGARVG